MRAVSSGGYARRAFKWREPFASGLKLLREWLSQEQLAQYDAHRYFEVIGCQTGKRYRIYYGTGANVIELDDAALPRTGWCFVPSDHLVVGDVMLAQKIALETDEQGALAMVGRNEERHVAANSGRIDQATDRAETGLLHKG